MLVAIEGMPLANPRVERRRSSPPLYERYGTPSQVRLGDIRRSASYGSMGILEKSAFAPRDPTRRGRERRNLPSPTSTDLERFAGGVSGGIAAKPRMLILESFRWHSSRAARERATVLV